MRFPLGLAMALTLVNCALVRTKKNLGRFTVRSWTNRRARRRLCSVDLLVSERQLVERYRRRNY